MSPVALVIPQPSIRGRTEKKASRQGRRRVLILGLFGLIIGSWRVRGPDAEGLTRKIWKKSWNYCDSDVLIHFHFKKYCLFFIV